MIPKSISCRLSNHKWPWPKMCSLSMASLRSPGSKQPPPSVAGWGQLGKPLPICVTSPVFLTERSVLCVELYRDSVCENAPLLRSFSQALAFSWFYKKCTGNLAEFFFTFFWGRGCGSFSLQRHILYFCQMLGEVQLTEKRLYFLWTICPCSIMIVTCLELL